MPDSQCSTPATTKQDDITLKRSFEKYCAMEKPSLTEAQKRKRYIKSSSPTASQHSQQNPQQPRWHNQSYMLFLALRQHSEKTMARTDLIKSALAIDKRISEERQVPKVFRGKTPMNSASAILTNNNDRYFVPFKPEGSKSMHFKLSFEPGSFESALKEYNEWQENLIKNDWSNWFGGNSSSIKDGNDDNDSNKMKMNHVVKELDVKKVYYPTEFDEFMAKRKKARLSQQGGGGGGGGKENMSIISTQKQAMKDTPTTASTTNILTPQSWQEIISIRNENGVFANRQLPKNIPIGFYFGVPLSEDEFDSMKSSITKSNHYSFMYKKTIIDPTDKNGELYNQIICPFHYIKEITSKEKANVVFYEGEIVNQIICWTKKEILPGEELFYYCPNITSNALPLPSVTLTATAQQTTSPMMMMTPSFIVQPQPHYPIASAQVHVQPQHVLPPPPLPQPSTAATATAMMNGNKNSTNDTHSEYWQKKPSISLMLNTTIPI